MTNGPVQDPQLHDRRERSDPPGWRPVPDPTALTTEALHREIAGLRELVEAWNEGTNGLIIEKFRSVDAQLQLVENQRIEQKSDTKLAVDAALAAQKEAVREQTIAFQLATSKSETTIKEQLGQITLTFTTALQGITTTLDDLKARLGRVEAIRVGGLEQRQEQRADWSTLAAVVIATLAIIGYLAATR